jgi:hypothetical protein
MTFDEWLQTGLKNNWCGPSVCATHDGIPMTEGEEDFMDNEDACIHIIRLYKNVVEKRLVEQNHSPSIWRATNSGFEV